MTGDRYWTSRDFDEAAERRERVRARMARGETLVEPTPEPRPRSVGRCVICGANVVRTADGRACDPPGLSIETHRPRTRPFTERQLQTRVARLIRDVETAAKQCVAESGGNGFEPVSMDDACHDIGLSLAMMVPEPVRARFFAGYLGWDPVGDADLYRRERTDPRLAR